MALANCRRSMTSGAAPSGEGAQPGFGLPEVFGLIGEVLLERLAPRDEREAQAIQRFYREFGPLPAESFRRAIETTRRALGPDRPLGSYLDHLTRQIRRDQNNTSTTDEEMTP